MKVVIFACWLISGVAWFFSALFQYYPTLPSIDQFGLTFNVIAAAFACAASLFQAFDQ
jgi:hypothetical protein